MNDTVTYYTNTPFVHRKFSEILAKFKELKREGVSPKIMREYFLKDELLALLLWFSEKSEVAEGFSNVFAEYEEVSHE